MKLISAAVATVLGVSAASAADIAPRYAKAPPLLPAYDWSGFYLGVNAGLGFGRGVTSLAIPGIGNTVESQRLGGLGAIGGGQIGYNAQWGNIVLGVEADIQGAGLRDNRTCGLLCVQQFTDFAIYDQKLDWFGTVRGRIGLADGPIFGYVTGGFAYGSVKTNLTDSIGLATGAISLNDTRTGWTVGSGIEAALGGNWTGKIEYLYLDLGSQSATFALGPVSQSLTSDIREHIFRVGLNYRIGGTRAYAPAQVANWTGFYVGGNAGGATALNRSSFNSVGGLGVDGAQLFNISPDGFIGGAQIGYNWQSANWVIGLEADIQGSTQKDDKTCIMLCSPNGFVAFDQKMQWFGTVRGRLGYSVGASLFYATGGLAYGDVTTRVSDLSFNGVFANPSFSHTKAGWTVGAGLERPFNWLGRNWTAKTEYLYVDLGKSTDAYVTDNEARTFSTHAQAHVFRAGLNYHFDSPVVAKY